MHALPPEKAFLYWIPSILVAIGMFITLLCSFWKFHKRKMFIRQLQLEYVEVNLAAKRPRIGAIRCNTHGAKWEDLMASLTSSGFPNIKPYFRQNSKLVTPRQYDTLYEENEEAQSSKNLSATASDSNAFSNVNEKSTGLNLYYEQTGNIQSESQPRKISSKKKKKKKSRLHIYGGAHQRRDPVDDDDTSYTTAMSPRRLPVMENQLWAGYSPELYSITNERQLPSIYYARSIIHSSENDIPQPFPPKPSHSEHRNSHKESKQNRKEKPPEERVFWVLAADIKQSSV